LKLEKPAWEAARKLASHAGFSTFQLAAEPGEPAQAQSPK